MLIQTMRMLMLVPLLMLSAFAQAPTFEVASVKLQPWTGQGGVGVFVRGDTLHGEHATLFDLVKFAYDLRDEAQLSGGPEWADRTPEAKIEQSELYQVIGKAAGNPPPALDVFRQMLQTLLAERFQLKVHHIQKDFPTYNLVVNKGGPRLKPSTADATFSVHMSSDGPYAVRFEAAQTTMQRLADTLSGPYSGRQVYDKTGLTGNYDFTLGFVGDMVLKKSPDAATDKPTLRTAVEEQLGLKLEPATGSFDTVVIDHAERPSGN